MHKIRNYFSTLMFATAAIVSMSMMNQDSAATG